MRTSAQRLDFPIQAALDAIIFFKLFSQQQTIRAEDDTALLRLCSCLYLSAKVNEFELVKIRDIINVVQFTMLNAEPQP